MQSIDAFVSRPFIFHKVLKETFLGPLWDHF